MSQKVNVAVTGYFGTGSSAVVDLLKEYSNIRIVPYSNKSYEHNLFYHHGGLYDLCSLLTRGNTLYTSDKVINNFITEMKRLNDYNYVWFGSYQKLFDDKFMNLVYKFVNTIATKREDKTTNHIIRSRFSLIKLCGQLALRIIQGRKFSNYGIKYIYDDDNVYCALPSDEELYTAAKAFTNGYFSLFETDSQDEIKIFDHIIWPAEIDAFQDCFDDNFKMIIVDRDPRDLFILDKYIWSKNKFRKSKQHFPDSATEFAKEWENTLIKKYNNKNAYKVHFEDLIYDYDATVKKIETFLGLKVENHVFEKKHLDPLASIENTQVFKVNNEWEKEVATIEEMLPELLYTFPYERRPERSKMFADDSMGKVKI